MNTSTAIRQYALKRMFSVNVWNSRLKCCHHTPTRGDCSVMSSRTSDQPPRRPHGRTCWDGDAALRVDDDWRNVDADDWRRRRRTYSSPPGTGELCVADTDELSDRAWTELVRERRASASRHEEDVPSHGRTSECRWRDVLRHSAHAGVCLWCTCSYRILPQIRPDLDPDLDPVHPCCREE